MGWLKKMLNPLKAAKHALDPGGLVQQSMKLTPQKLIGGKPNPGAIQNPYDNEMPSAAGLQKMQKPPVNLGPRAKPAYQTNSDMSKPANAAISKPYYAPGTAQNPIDVGFTTDPSITPVDPKEEYFAQNAQRMKPQSPDMYSMRKNREADRFYQRPRNMIR